MKKQFVNELGNEIDLEINQIDESIEIKLKGPNSETEWIVTKKEALEIKELLGKTL